jgi:Fe2+ or Zn2+ uptake regulation protein
LLKIAARLAVVKSPDELIELFRSRGLKVTPQRLRIFQALHGSPEHPTAESVHALVRAELPTISLRTVYQTLNDLAAMGELSRLDLATGSARFDPNLDRHHHLVCERCGQVRDIHTDFTDVRVPAGHDHGFRVSTTEIVFRGVCASCQTHGDDRSPAIPITRGGATING